MTDPNQITDAINWLLNLGAAPFTGIACWIFCYVFRAIPVFPNRWIPIICIVTGGIVFPILNPHASSIAPAAFYAHSIVGGLAIGIAAWLTHDKWAGRIEDAIALKFTAAAVIFTSTQSDGTKTFTKPVP